MVYQFDWGTPMYCQSINLRSDVLRTPLGLKFKMEDLVLESNLMHFGFFDNFQCLLACLILSPSKKSVKLKQMAVLEEVQGKGFGKRLVTSVEHVAHIYEYDRVYLHARKSAIGFYEKLNYKIVSEEFLELGILHNKMEKKI